MSGLTSFSQTEDGRKTIEDAITANDDGSYSVTFKGINKTVTVNQKELKDARLNGYYSIGDNTILLLEVAGEKAIWELFDDFDMSLCDYTLCLGAKYYTLNDEEKKKVDNLTKYIKLLNKCFRGENPIESFSLEKIIQLFGLSNGNMDLMRFPKNDENQVKVLLDNTNFKNSINELSFSIENTITSDKGKPFNILTNHSYTIKSYNSEDGTVKIINPHDSSDSATISIAELNQYADTLKIYTL